MSLPENWQIIKIIIRGNNMSGSNSRFLSEKDNIQALRESIVSSDMNMYNSFGFNRAEPSFQNKVFVIYRPNGLHADGTHRPPEILGQVKVIDWYADAEEGPNAILEDMSSGEQVTIGVVPCRIFNYDVFFACPPYSKYRFDAKETGSGLERSMLFTLLISCETRADHYSKGVTLCESQKEINRLYPDLDFKISHF